jgi:hypothetical protein
VKKLTILILILFITGVSFANSRACGELLSPPLFMDRPTDLLLLYKKDTASLSKKEIAKKNKVLLKSFENYVPEKIGKGVLSISFSKLKEIFSQMERTFIDVDHKQYSRDGVEIGYCFGRAYFIHMMLLKMGVQPNSIRKLWAVGNLKSRHSEVPWDFHVTTVVYVEGYGWMTLDTRSLKPGPVRHWFTQYMDDAVDGRSVIYITDPQKFSVSIGRYSRLELGFNLTKENDWYQHFFVDHTQIIRQTPVIKIK